MDFKRFSSPREEALEIAWQARKDVLEGDKNVVSILRSCLVIATNLNKIDKINWLKNELAGYSRDETPKHRKINCYYLKNGIKQRDSQPFPISLEAHMLDDYSSRNQDINLSYD